MYNGPHIHPHIPPEEMERYRQLIKKLIPSENVRLAMGFGSLVGMLGGPLGMLAGMAVGGSLVAATESIVDAIKKK